MSVNSSPYGQSKSCSQTNQKMPKEITKRDNQPPVSDRWDQKAGCSEVRVFVVARATQKGRGTSAVTSLALKSSSSQEQDPSPLTAVFTILTIKISFPTIVNLCGPCRVQSRNGLEMGGAARRNNEIWGSCIRIIAAVCEHQNNEQIPLGAKKASLLFYFDGTKDTCNADIEISFVGYFDFEDHQAKVEFFSDDELDFGSGDSLNAPALLATQMVAFERRLGPDFKNILKTSTAGVSFDGASVLVGCKDSAMPRWLNLAPQVPEVVEIHGVAHRLESCYADASSEIPCTLFIDELCAYC